MSEHYTKNTVEVSVYCAKCGKDTEHRVDGGRRGPCLVCLRKLNADHLERIARDAQTMKQTSLF